MNIRVQAVVDEVLKTDAEEIFADYGLNLTEGIKLLLSNFVKGRISLNVSANRSDETIELSERRKAEFENDKSDIIAGKRVYKIDSKSDLHQEIMALADAD